MSVREQVQHVRVMWSRLRRVPSSDPLPITHHPSPHLLHRERGFTFIEIMVVVAILAILAALVVPRIMGRTDDAKRTAAKVQIRNIEGALQLYKLDNGVYPTTEQGLKALVEKPSVGIVPKKWKLAFRSAIPQNRHTLSTRALPLIKHLPFIASFATRRIF